VKGIKYVLSTLIIDHRVVEPKANTIHTFGLGEDDDDDERRLIEGLTDYIESRRKQLMLRSSTEALVPHIFKTSQLCPYASHEGHKGRKPSQAPIKKEENGKLSLVYRGDNKVLELALQKNEVDATRCLNVMHIERNEETELLEEFQPTPDEDEVD